MESAPRKRDSCPLRRKLRQRRLLIWSIVALASIWVGGDFSYSRIVALRLDEWEESVDRYPDGVRVGCRARTVGAGEDAILLIHGFGDSPAVFRNMEAALAAAGYTVRAMRLPGFGEPIEALATVAKSQWNDAVAREISRLREDHRRVVVVGHSLGGALAVEHLLDHPGDADAAVLIAPLLRVSDQRSPVLSARAWYQCGGALLHCSDVVESVFSRDLVAEANAGPDLRDRFVPRNVYDNLFAIIDRIDDRGDEFGTPLLLFTAAEDRVVDTEAAERFFSDVATDAKRCVRFDNAGHVLPLEKQWRAMTTEIVDFARALPSPAS